MRWWLPLSSLGNLGVTVLIALTIAAWLAGAHCRRLALAWCLLFVGALILSAGSQIVFLGWGVGIDALAFTGFSGHATRAAAVYPVALYLLLHKERPWVRHGAACTGVLLAAGVAVARVAIGAHSPSEAASGLLLGLATAALFLSSAGNLDRRTITSRPLLVGLLTVALLLPSIVPVNPHQWLTTVAMKLAGRERTRHPSPFGSAHLYNMGEQNLLTELNYLLIFLPRVSCFSR